MSGIAGQAPLVVFSGILWMLATLMRKGGRELLGRVHDASFEGSYSV